MKTFSINHVLNHWGACMALMRVVVVRIMTRIFFKNRTNHLIFIKY
nr:MAG TPA: hypothetical protein [Caudoviricetes sp.]